MTRMAQRAALLLLLLARGAARPTLCQHDDAWVDGGWFLDECKTLTLTRPVDPADVVDLVRALRDNHMLRTLVAQNVSLGDEGAAALARALPEGYCVLTNLLIGRNGITDVGAAALAEAMPKSQLLYLLNLANNEIGDDGAAAFARALRAGSDVFTLGLSWNRVGDAGAEALAEALASRSGAPSLELLALSGNRIGDAGGKALRGALDVHKTIGGVELTGNRMAPGLVDEVNALLEARIEARDTRPEEARLASAGSNAGNLFDENDPRPAHHRYGYLQEYAPGEVERIEPGVGFGGGSPVEVDREPPSRLEMKRRRMNAADKRGSLWERLTTAEEGEPRPPNWAEERRDEL
jgi:Ran GTPase-activating protein (RanGAP) involved in mRNA processing and transport